MKLAIDILLHAGRSAVDVALYTLLPILVLMMIVMRAFSARPAVRKFSYSAIAETTIGGLRA
jgi:hypothetical protein